jgi:hypothetical protein
VRGLDPYNSMSACRNDVTAFSITGRAGNFMPLRGDVSLTARARRRNNCYAPMMTKLLLTLLARRSGDRRLGAKAHDLRQRRTSRRPVVDRKQRHGHKLRCARPRDQPREHDRQRHDHVLRCARERHRPHLEGQPPASL